MSRTIAIGENATIDVDAADVWAYVEDYSNDLAWRAGVAAMTPSPPGPPRVGTEVHEVVRKLGSTYVTNSTVTEVGPGYRYRFAGEGDSGRVDGGRAVVANADGTTTFTYDIELHLEGMLARLAPAVAWFMRRALRRDVRRLRRILEQQHPRSAG